MTKEISNGLKVKQIVRTISLGGDGVQVAEVDAYVSSWVDQGYALKNTHVLATPSTVDGHMASAVVLYVLVKE